MVGNMTSMCVVFRNIYGRNRLSSMVSGTVLRRQPLFFNAKGKEQSTDSDKRTAEGEAPEGPIDPASAETGPQISESETLLKAENAKLLEKVIDIDDKYKRALAEGENSRIRMRKQVEDAKIYGIQGFCKDVLDVADVLVMAIDTVPKESLSQNAALKNLFEGVQMTEQQLQSVFRRHGLTKINPIGEKFNPNEHHALFEAEVAEKEPGTVATVTKVGYKLHERTIRPAMVGVVKAANK